MKRILSTVFLGLALAVSLAACGGDDDGGGGGGGADAATVCSGADPLPFMCPCTIMDVDRCDTAAGDSCFDFNDKGPHCSHECDTAEDCAAPSGGCSGMGVCKAPD